MKKKLALLSLIISLAFQATMVSAEGASEQIGVVQKLKNFTKKHPYITTGIIAASTVAVLAAVDYKFNKGQNIRWIADQSKDLYAKLFLIDLKEALGRILNSKSMGPEERALLEKIQGLSLQEIRFMNWYHFALVRGAELSPQDFNGEGWKQAHDMIHKLNDMELIKVTTLADNWVKLDRVETVNNVWHCYVYGNGFSGENRLILWIKSIANTIKTYAFSK